MLPVSRTLVTGAIVFGILGSAACGAGASDPAPGQPVGAADGPVANTAAPAPTVSAATRTDRAIRAVRTATRRAGVGQPYDLESDRFRGGFVWEVKVAAGKRRPHEVLVGPNGKRVIRHRQIRPENGADRVRSARVGLIRAIRIAGREVAGRLDEAGIDRTRGGNLVWEANFDISRHREAVVTVDAGSGKVLRVRHDD